MTPGQAAYEAYDAAASARDGVRLPPWQDIKEAHRADWEATAQAAVSEGTYAFAKDEILANAGPEWDQPRVPEAIAVDYVRHLERERDANTELLRQAADALWRCAKAALTVKTSLNKPYPDEPQSTPWMRWVERPAREAHDLAMTIRKHLKAGGP